jgi:hypothetical protein
LAGVARGAALNERQGSLRSSPVAALTRRAHSMVELTRSHRRRLCDRSLVGAAATPERFGSAADEFNQHRRLQVLVPAEIRYRRARVDREPTMKG